MVPVLAQRAALSCHGDRERWEVRYGDARETVAGERATGEER